MNQFATLNDYLYNNELNISIYKVLKKDYLGLFDYLQFFNDLYGCHEFFEKNQENYYFIETEFDAKIQLQGLRRFVFLSALVKVIQHSHYSGHGDALLFSEGGAQSYNYINELLTDITEELFGTEGDEESESANLAMEEVPLSFNSNLEDITNSQTVLIYYYFLKGVGLEIRRDINIATVAKFMHLITGKPFTIIQNSEFNKKLQKAPNFKSDGELIKDLEAIKSLFKKVELNDIIKLIDIEIGTAKKNRKRFFDKIGYPYTLL